MSILTLEHSIRTTNSIRIDLIVLHRMLWGVVDVTCIDLIWLLDPSLVTAIRFDVANRVGTCGIQFVSTLLSSRLFLLVSCVVEPVSISLVLIPLPAVGSLTLLGLTIFQSINPSTVRFVSSCCWWYFSRVDDMSLLLPAANWYVPSFPLTTSCRPSLACCSMSCSSSSNGLCCSCCRCWSCDSCGVDTQEGFSVRVGCSTKCTLHQYRFCDLHFFLANAGLPLSATASIRLDAAVDIALLLQLLAFAHAFDSVVVCYFGLVF